MQRREAIAVAAMRCFARDGFASTSMADIIAEAGSSAGSVYSHFASKAELVRFTASSAMSELVAAASGGLPSERGPAVILAHLLEASDRSTRARSLLQIWAEVPRDPELEEIATHNLADLRAHISDALSDWCRDSTRSAAISGDQDAAAQALADVILTSLQGYLVRVTIDRSIDSRALASRLTGVLEVL
ncbi:TetR/AcrR family transcriptional regulator [Microbacterium sp. EST19A]|uniref:TetR/AcrR family transcriptional regulator n=1 Tax=Microbacterium sp. EST19A TaxID=2862681 RepID=UPI001CBEEBA9|nr:TetR family transcriptional regulator [Microbacterium sp. EST19A]